MMPLFWNDSTNRWWQNTNHGECILPYISQTWCDSLVQCYGDHLWLFWFYSWSTIKIYLYDFRWFKDDMISCGIPILQVLFENSFKTHNCLNTFGFNLQVTMNNYIFRYIYSGTVQLDSFEDILNGPLVCYVNIFIWFQGGYRYYCFLRNTYSLG